MEGALKFLTSGYPEKAEGAYPILGFLHYA
jgi:hypothetical protein